MFCLLKEIAWIDILQNTYFISQIQTTGTRAHSYLYLGEKYQKFYDLFSACEHYSVHNITLKRSRVSKAESAKKGCEYEFNYHCQEPWQRKNLAEN